MNLTLLRIIMFCTRQAAYGILLQMICIQLVFAEAVHSQDLREIKLDIQVQDARLVDVLDKIEAQTDLEFAYSGRVKKYARTFTFSLRKSSVHQVLEMLSEDGTIRFHQANKTITVTVLRPDPATPRPTPNAQSEVTPIEVLPAAAQDMRTVTGKVTEMATGDPMPGCSVRVKGTDMGTITDASGQFTIEAPDDAALVVSFIGYKTVEIVVGASTVVNVSLENDISTLDEFVVVGYGEQKRSDVTGAMSSVSNDKLVATNYTTATQALAGQLPGVDIVASGTKPGGGADIMIRGQNTIKSLGTTVNAINPPLYVLDGIYVSSINDINPSDIERIDVLKDASSTAIYGSRGANGVIIITTRKGKQEGKTSIEYKGFGTVNSAMNLPDFTNADQWVQYRIDRAKGNNYKDSTYDPDLLTLLGQSAYDNYKAGKSIDWAKEVLQTRYSQSHSVNVNGNADGLTYGLGLGLNSDNGVIEGDSYNRYNASVALSKQINKVFKVGTSVYTAYEITKNASPETFRTVYRLSPLGNKYDTDGSLLFYPDGAGLSTITNPLLEAPNRHTQSNNSHVFGNMFLEVKPLSWLKFTTTFAPDITHTESASYIGSKTKTGAGALANSSASYAPSRTVKYTWDNILFAQKTWGDHDVNLTLGNSWYRSDRMASSLAARAFPTDAYDWYNMGSGTMSSMSTAYTQEQLKSVFGRVNYEYKGRYLLTATGRRDGSSKLAEGHKWAFFPSAAVAWRISEEEFLKDRTPLSNLKLRFSYGVSGNNGVAPYSTYPTVDNTTKYLFDNTPVTTSSIARFENKNLSWELTKEFNLGLDFELYQGRIGGTIDVYNRRTNDIIMSRVMSQLNGFTSLTDNVGSVNNKGIEVALNTVNIKTGDFSWRTSLNFYSNHNEIVKLSDGSSRDEANKWFVGQPVGVVWTYDQVGYWGEGETDAAKYGLAPGSIKVRDIDNSGTMNNADKVFKGSLFPSWIGGITNTLTYKNFDMAFTVTTRQGQYVDSQFHRSYSMQDNQYFNVLDLNYWTPQNTSGTWVRPGVPSGPMEVLYYQKVSYVKVGYINLGYSLPQQSISKLGLSKFRVFASCQNPFIFTDYAGWDPEMANQDTQGPAYPMTRKFMLGLNLAF